MADETKLSWEGIQLVWVVLGLFGAALGVGTLPPMTTRQCWVALGSGLVFAAYGPLWVNHAFQHWVPAWANPTQAAVPSFMLGSAAFICGVGGMFLVPAILSFWRDPRAFAVRAWEFIKLARGKQGGE